MALPAKTIDYRLRVAIRETMQSHGMSQTELARRAGVDRTALGRYLRCRVDLCGRAVDALRRTLALVIVDPLDDEE